MPPQKRDVGMVFQNWALYPNMRVFDNIAFPLKVKGEPKGEIKKRVEEVASILGISDILDRYPGQLSGGQQQRVALARALVKRPSILLLDEPFSNLDARVRATARTFVKKIQRELGITTILVTHDQADAFAVADRLVVLHRGRIIQTGTPKELYEEPANTFIASFIGDPPINILDLEDARRILEGVDLSVYPQGSKVAFRPDDSMASTKPTGGGFTVKGRVEITETIGSRDYAEVNAGGRLVKALINPAEHLQPGQDAIITIRKMYIFGPDGAKIATLKP